MKLRTIALQSKLRLITLATKMRVAVGEFIAAALFANNASVSDAPSKQPRKSRIESLTLTDQMVFIPNKRPSENVGATDGDNPYFAEDYVTGAPSAQNYTIAGGFFWFMTKLLQDASAVSDQVAKTLPSKVFTETVNATDDVNGAAAGDDQIFQYFKVTTNLAAVSDGVIARAVSKTLSDGGAATDDGSLRMQNYTVDMTYFAEDYVGTSSVFS